MEQELQYRGVRTVIGGECDGRRNWAIHPEGAPPVSGVARADGGRRGSFKEAVFAARFAVDALLGAEGQGRCS